jgi:colanic acid/amylovoran biosynthesis glycosyltransferase
MVLHLERKFASITETFIPNQINAIHRYQNLVLTVKNLKNFSVNASVLSSEDDTLLATKFLSIKSRKYFQSILEQRCPFVIHAHYLTDARFFHSLTSQYKIPKICSCYGYDVSGFPRKYGWLSKTYLKKVFFEYQYILAMSDDMRNDLINLGCEEKKILVHYHGIDTNAFDIDRSNKFLNSGKLNLLTVASLFPFKGHETVLKSLHLLKSRRPDIDFVYQIVGNGPEKLKLKKFVAKNQLEKNVVFFNAIRHGPEFLKLLSSADVFLHPSKTSYDGTKEGIPGAIVEAMASGLPVISSFHAGIPSVIQDGTTGYLVNEGDYENICNRLVLLYEDITLRQQIGDNARNHSRANLDLFAKARELEEIYDRCLKESSSKN